MTSVGEIFVRTLSEASTRAERFLYKKHLTSQDRDDIVATAILWCWENRDNYSLTTSLDTWFLNAVRNAYQDWRRGETRNAAELMDAIPTGDTTQADAEAYEAAEKLVAAMPPSYWQALRLHIAGYTRTEMRAQGVSHDAVNAVRKRVQQLRRLLPDDHEYRRVLRAAPSQDSDELHARGPEPPIDRELERLDFPPEHGADCPPCWRCKWFEGYLPGAYRSQRMPIQEPEVRDAVRDVEARKIEIAQWVRAGAQE